MKKRSVFPYKMAFDDENTTFEPVNGYRYLKDRDLYACDRPLGLTEQKFARMNPFLENCGNFLGPGIR